MRKEYEEAIKNNKKAIEKYNEQHKLSVWMKFFPNRTEKYIIRLYSSLPYNMAELEKILKNLPDEKAKKRIIATVGKQIRIADES